MNTRPRFSATRTPVTSGRPLRGVLLAALAACGLLAGAGASHAQTYVVDRSNPAASPSGPGTAAAPYNTITAALAAHHAAGTVLQVQPGVYPEQVTLPASGLSGSPIVIQAAGTAGSPVIVDGSDDYSDPTLWMPAGINVWQAASVTWAPKQVFADGTRLASSAAAPAALPPGSFTYVAGSGLYVNVGGDTPALHAARVGHRPYGFYISGKSWVTVQGFTVTRCEDRGIQLQSAASNIEVVGNAISFAGRFGIQASGCSAVHLASNQAFDNADHGISLVAGTTGSLLEDNECYRNVYPPAREANGIYLYGCPGNVLQRNRLHDNQDTGLQLQSGSNGNLCIENLSWSNGDHGYDHLMATGNIHVGDVAFGNYRDGFSIEGLATGQQLHNCIATDNGLTTNEFDLWVDAASSSGLVSDYNIFWNSTNQVPVKYGTTLYASVGSYSAASGHDSHTFQSDPLFVDAAHGDFHVNEGSPAIDDGNSGCPYWPATDAAGNPRVDDPSMPNRGAGPIRYADRGAYEFVPSGSNLPPVAALTVTPASGTAPLAVTADASGSYDRDGAVVSYRFDFGDGAMAGPQTSPTATHTYAAGSWTATVLVRDNQGGTATATVSVSVAGSGAGPNLVGNPSFETDASGWAPYGNASMQRMPGGYDGGWALQLDGPGFGRSEFGVTDQPNWVSSTPASGVVYRITAWVRSSDAIGQCAISIRESRAFRKGTSTARSRSVTLSTNWQLLSLSYQTRWRGSSLDLSIGDTPVRTAETFQVDAISMERASGGAAALAAGIAPDDAMDASADASGGLADPSPESDGVAPNPFGSQARLRFSLARPGPVSLNVFDLSGRLVRRLLDQAPLAAGRNVVALDGRGDDGAALRGGLYFYEVRTLEGTRTGRFVIVR